MTFPEIEFTEYESEVTYTNLSGCKITSFDESTWAQLNMAHYKHRRRIIDIGVVFNENISSNVVIVIGSRNGKLGVFGINLDLSQNQIQNKIVGKKIKNHEIIKATIDEESVVLELDRDFDYFEIDTMVDLLLKCR